MNSLPAHITGIFVFSNAEIISVAQTAFRRPFTISDLNYESRLHPPH